VPTEDLERLLAALGQKPKLSELAELLSALQALREERGLDGAHFGFDDFCQVFKMTTRPTYRIIGSHARDILGTWPIKKC
jgi:hypothetical protein